MYSRQDFSEWILSFFMKEKVNLIVQKLFILKLEPDLDPESKKVSEHGPWGILLRTVGKIWVVIRACFLR